MSNYLGKKKFDEVAKALAESYKLIEKLERCNTPQSRANYEKLQGYIKAMEAHMARQAKLYAQCQIRIDKHEQEFQIMRQIIAAEEQLNLLYRTNLEKEAQKNKLLLFGSASSLSHQQKYEMLQSAIDCKNKAHSLELTITRLKSELQQLRSS